MNTENSSSINVVSVVGNLDLNTPETELCFADGRIVRLPTVLLQQQQTLANVRASGPTVDETLLIPLVEEQMQVVKHTVETGKVYLHKSSEAFELALNEPLTVNTWKVERVPRNEVITELPGPRQEGSTTIYPLIEERLILTKELVLIEEIRVSHELSERRDGQTVTLRREALRVEREAPKQT